MDVYCAFFTHLSTGEQIELISIHTLLIVKIFKSFLLYFLGDFQKPQALSHALPFLDRKMRGGRRERKEKGVERGRGRRGRGRRGRKRD